MACLSNLAWVLRNRLRGTHIKWKDRSKFPFSIDVHRRDDDIGTARAARNEGQEQELILILVKPKWSHPSQSTIANFYERPKKMVLSLLGKMKVERKNHEHLLVIGKEGIEHRGLLLTEFENWP